MKRILLLTVVVGLLAGQASADLYSFDLSAAASLRQVSISEGGTGLTYVGYTPGTALVNKIAGSDNFYGATHPMYYSVGFTGQIKDLSGDAVSSMLIGITDAINYNVFASIQAAGSFDGFSLRIANDNDDTWQYKLWVDTDAGVGIEYETAWTPAVPGLASPGQIALTLTFPEIDFSHLTGIGFGIQFNRDGNPGDGDEFHTSIVPVPAALLLGLLGFGAAGLKLRRFA